MRYTVKLHIGSGNIENVISTDCLAEAIKLEHDLQQIWGRDNVWIADSLMELLVG